MRYLICGVAGFVGSNLARRLINDGHEVIGIDNFSHGKRENIEGLDMRFIENDVSVVDLLDLEFDACIHLASQKIPRYSSAYNTVVDNYNMLDACISACLHNKARLLFASTSDVYGKNAVVPFREEDALVMGSTTVRRWSYAVSKIHGEHYLHAAAEEFGLEFTIMRFFSAYGPRQAAGWWGGVQSAFMDAIIAGQPIEIHGSGMQTRCFTYIDDLIDGIILCLGDRARNEIYNIGNPGTLTTIYGLAKVLFQVFGVIVPVNYLPYSSLGKYEDAETKIPDISKIRALGFDPKVNLLDGLTRTAEWLTKNSQK